VETFHRYKFAPEEHKCELIGIINELNELVEYNEKKLGQVLKRYPKNGNKTYSKSEIIQGFRAFSSEHDWNEAHFFDRLRMKPIRTASGVAPVTVLTKPYPCPGKCIFCPSDVRMPKSYLSMEPGAQRAAQNAFDPYAQTLSRLKAFHFNGHPLNKIELIILGGTWTSYPRSYQIWFVKRCLDAMNEFTGREEFGRPELEHDMDFLDLDTQLDGTKIEQSYNDIVSSFLKEKLDGKLLHHIEHASQEALEEAKKRNIHSDHRCVGLVIETRPDEITPEELIRIRQLGATKIQIGIQSLDDRILELNQRGHDVATTKNAVRLLREAGFKIHAHWMPNLFGADVASDIADFDHLFDDIDFKPDELKIYPCSLIESAELMEKYEAGLWRPYSQDELVEIMEAVLPRVPEYCRVTRVIRDIPSHDIVVGNKLSNFRELATKQIAKTERTLQDIRSREIRNLRVDANTLRCVQIVYETSIGPEHFLQYVTPENKIVAFLRLTLPTKTSFIDEISNSAMIRELHVYGPVVKFGKSDSDKSQHVGLGTQLIERAIEIAQTHGFKSLAVISAIGTQAYYHKQGFHDGLLYMHRSLSGEDPMPK
jgi:elongator complex protein 3